MTDRNPTLAEQLAAFARPRFTPYDPKTGEGLEPRAQAYSRVIEDGEYTAPGARASNEYGVLFRADHETLADGMCRQARTHARALDAHIPVLLASINGRVRRPVFDTEGKQLGVQSFARAGDDMLEPEVFEDVGALRRTQIRNYVAVVYYTLIHSAQALQTLLLPEYTRATIGAAEELLARTVVYTPWERSTVPRDVIELLKDVGQVWLQCTRNVNTFVDAGLPRHKIRLMAPAFEARGPMAQMRLTRRPPRGKRFYNIGKWEPRKAQHELIGAFLRTFTPTSEASLTLKVSYFGEWANYPSHRDSVRLWLADAAVRERGWTSGNVTRGVRMYDAQFTTEQMTKLHALHNIYVSTSHAEGWDYPAFDAKVAGNRLVYVAFSGAEDYAAETDVSIPHRLGPVHPQYQWEPEAEWAVCSIDDIAAVLNEVDVVADLTPRCELEWLAEHFGSVTSGAQMRACLHDLIAVADPPLNQKVWR